MNQPEDGLKWFGEGFDGFPKILPDDCVEYTIYVIDSKLSDLEKAGRLRNIQSALRKLTTELTKDFIWQREGINITLEHDGGQSYLRGRTNYGDSVDDEWLVVYILRELGKDFPDVWIRIIDTDGQFLLIEAAGVIPRWLNPEIADFRLWLNNGDLLIIPLDKSIAKDDHSKPEAKALTLKDSLHYLETHRSQLINSPAIQAEAFYRLQKYPEQIVNSLHHAIVRIPRNLAYVLHENPACVSSAIEAFYLRDPISLRPLQASESNKLVFPPQDFVSVSTKFTKVGYAQLKSQRFDVPTAWVQASLVGYDESPSEEADIGVKLSCGFEMLMSDPQNQDKRIVREITIMLDDLQTEKDLLPSDVDISKWDRRQDNEKWLDISLEDLEKELNANKGNGVPAASNGGFGDQNAQDNLRKMVARFEEFLNDDDAGAEGAEVLDDMDHDDDDESLASDGSGQYSEDKDISFDENEFTSMMREMMGLSTGLGTTDTHVAGEIDPSSREAAKSISSDEEKDGVLQRDMDAMEGELREAGAFDLDANQEKKCIDTRPSGTEESRMSSIAGQEGEEEDVAIDYRVAKNLLESFKSQAGVSGPGSNLMGMLGIQLSRDEGDQG